MKGFFTIAISTLLVISCNKSDKLQNETLWIRIENKAGITLPELRIGDVTYGDLAVGGTTEYRKITEPLYTPVCQFIKNGRDFYAGLLICGTPPLPPAPESGFYKYTVLPDNGGYHMIEVTKE